MHSGDVSASGNLLLIFPWAVTDTTSFSSAWEHTSAALRLFLCKAGVTGGFPGFVCVLQHSGEMDLLLRAAAGLNNCAGNT